MSSIICTTPPSGFVASRCNIRSRELSCSYSAGHRCERNAILSNQSSGFLLTSLQTRITKPTRVQYNSNGRLGNERHRSSLQDSTLEAQCRTGPNLSQAPISFCRLHSRSLSRHRCRNSNILCKSRLLSPRTRFSQNLRSRRNRRSLQSHQPVPRHRDHILRHHFSNIRSSARRQDESTIRSSRCGCRQFRLLWPGRYESHRNRPRNFPRSDECQLCWDILLCEILDSASSEHIRWEEDFHRRVFDGCSDRARTDCQHAILRIEVCSIEAAGAYTRTVC